MYHMVERHYESETPSSECAGARLAEFGSKSLSYEMLLRIRSVCLSSKEISNSISTTRLPSWWVKMALANPRFGREIAAVAGYDDAGGGKGYMPLDHSRAVENQWRPSRKSASRPLVAEAYEPKASSRWHAI